MSTPSTTPQIPEPQAVSTPALVPQDARSRVDDTPVTSKCSLGGSAEPKSNPWETCLDYAKEHVKAETELWKDEVGNLLIFASLFSAVVGAFAVESYHSVQQDPADTTVLLLRSLLILQLNATNPQPNLPIDLEPQIPIAAAARRINIYNFLSLILSLSVVMAGILCLQWLREYSQDPSGIPGPRREHLGIRFMRREGMESWRVFTVLRSLPLILLLSLLLFFAGIIELLLEVDKAATIVASVAIGITALFMLITTMLPTLQAFGVHFFPKLPQCPYKSPQAWLFYELVAAPIYWLTHAVSKWVKPSLCVGKGDTDVLNLQTWSGYDWQVYSGHYSTRKSGAISNVGFGLHWLGRMYLQEKRFAKALYTCIQDTSIHEVLRNILIAKDRRRAGSAERALIWFPPTGPDTQQLKEAYGLGEIRTLEEAQKLEEPQKSEEVQKSGEAQKLKDEEAQKLKDEEAQKLKDKEAQKLKDAHVADVIVFQTLAHLAEDLEHGHHATVLVKKRFQLFLKIIQQRLDPDIDYPVIDALDQKDMLAADTRKVILQYITELMESKMDANESHLSALYSILALEADIPHPEYELFQRMDRVLQSWMEHQKWEVDGDLEDSKTRLEAEARRLRNRIDILRRLATSRQPSA